MILHILDSHKVVRPVCGVLLIVDDKRSQAGPSSNIHVGSLGLMTIVATRPSRAVTMPRIVLAFRERGMRNSPDATLRR